MEKIAAALVAVFLVVFVVSIGALLGGTIVFFLWPVAVPAVFPGLIASGVLAAKITWWQAVCVTWLAGLLFKSSTTVKKDS